MCEENNKSHVWIKKQIYSNTIEPSFVSIRPRIVIITCDTTYFGKRSDKTELDGLMAFVDNLTGQVLWFKFLKNETNSDYQEGLKYLESKGFEILGVVSDGRRGLANIFKKYPYQVCQFHIQKGISTLLTKNPKSQAGKDLNTINKTFIKDKLTSQEYIQKIQNHLKNYQEYINEMSDVDPTKYKHQRHRKALNKLKNNLKHMFTHQQPIIDNPNTTNMKIPNTTNHIDGGLFSPMKNLLKNHNGLSKEHRKTLIIQFCNSRGKN